MIPSMRRMITRLTGPILKAASRTRATTPALSARVCSVPWRTSSSTCTRTCIPTRCCATASRALRPTCARTKSSTPSSRRSRATTTEQSRIWTNNRSTSRPGGALFCISEEENGRGHGSFAAPAPSESFAFRFFGQDREIGIAVFQERVDAKGILQLEQQ